MLHPLPDGAGFDQYSMLVMNRYGRYVQLNGDWKRPGDGRQIESSELAEHLERSIVLADGVTDVFIWIHGWRTDLVGAATAARRFFNGIVELRGARALHYPNLVPFVPSFIAVHWPAMSAPDLGGYRRIRNRAAALTERGDAEFFLASLLGYLTHERQRDPGAGTLRSRGGFYVHCVGHSFGGRFLTAAVRAAATPHSPRTASLLGASGPTVQSMLGGSAGRFEFTVDSILVFQMAAPRVAFGEDLRQLVRESPLSGPIVLTYSKSDWANCIWHRLAEHGEVGIGCMGAAEPNDHVSTIGFRGLDKAYGPDAFETPVVNVDASGAFLRAPSLLSPEGAHSDFWYEESMHLVLSIADYTHAHNGTTARRV